jgi:hypothetical protein
MSNTRLWTKVLTVCEASELPAVVWAVREGVFPFMFVKNAELAFRYAADDIPAALRKMDEHIQGHGVGFSSIPGAFASLEDLRFYSTSELMAEAACVVVCTGALLRRDIKICRYGQNQMK